MTYIKNKMGLSLKSSRQILFVAFFTFFMALPVLSMAGTVELLEMKLTSGTGFINGFVYDDTNNEPLVGATISADGGEEDDSNEEGYYILLLPEGTYTIICSFDGYSDTSFSGIRISEGEITDLNCPMTSVTSTDTTPDIKANDSEGTVTINEGDQLSITVSLSAEGLLGVDCDWWAAYESPLGWYYYNLSSWVNAGSSPAGLFPTYQGGLFDLPTYGIFSESGLSTGTYTFYFAIDTDMNGNLDLNQIYFDSVTVNVE